MNTRTTWGIIIFLLIAVVGVTLWFQLKPKPIAEEAATPNTYVPTLITAKHQFKDGVHIIAGEVDVPTPCYLVNTDALVEVREPVVDRATVAFTTVNEDDICAQVVTAARFKEVFHAQERAEIIATWNGSPVPLNLIEAGPDEDLDAFELFIKG